MEIISNPSFSYGHHFKNANRKFLFLCKYLHFRIRYQSLCHIWFLCNSNLNFLSHNNGSIRKLIDKCKFTYFLFVCDFWIPFSEKLTTINWLPNVRFLLNNYGLPNMHTKICAEWLGFVCTIVIQTKSKRL
jgi:hypothetical protein